MKFRIRYGLGGGFGGAGDWEEIEAKSLEAAEEEARQGAIEVYESYEGMHGLRTIKEVMEEECCDEEEAQEIYNEEVDSWIDYQAEELR
jgi:hypothetical protein